MLSNEAMSVYVDYQISYHMSIPANSVSTSTEIATRQHVIPSHLNGNNYPQMWPIDEFNCLGIDNIASYGRKGDVKGLACLREHQRRSVNGMIRHLDRNSIDCGQLIRGQHLDRVTQPAHLSVGKQGHAIGEPRHQIQIMQR
jgi:hypothetical protein